MSLTLNRAHIAAINNNYLFRGVVVTGARRFSDILNDRLSLTFKILDVNIYRLGDLAQPVFTTDEFYLRKQQFNLYALLKEERSAMTQRLYAFVPKERRPATLFVGGFKIDGDLHLKQKQESTTSLVREGDLFIPVTDASLVATHYPRFRMPSTTILLREGALDAFSIAEESFASNRSR